MQTNKAGMNYFFEETERALGPERTVKRNLGLLEYVCEDVFVAHNGWRLFAPGKIKEQRPKFALWRETRPALLPDLFRKS